MPPSKLFIKTKALERLLKEEDYYKQELQDQQTVVNTLKNDPSVDPYELKKNIEVLQDTERLFPTLYLKIDEFKQDLEKYLKQYSELSLLAVDSGNKSGSDSASTVDAVPSSASTAISHSNLSHIDKVEIDTLQPLIDELLEKANESIRKHREIHSV